MKHQAYDNTLVAIKECDIVEVELSCKIDFDDFVKKHNQRMEMIKKQEAEKKAS